MNENYVADNALNDVCWDCGYRNGMLVGDCNESFCPLREERAALREECNALFARINELAEKAKHLPSENDEAMCF